MAACHAGLFFWSFGLVDGILQRLLEEMGEDTTVEWRPVAWHQLISKGSKYIKHVDDFLYAGRPAPHLGAKHRGEARPPQQHSRKTFSVQSLCPPSKPQVQLSELYVENYFNYFTEMKSTSSSGAAPSYFFPP